MARQIHSYQVTSLPNLIYEKYQINANITKKRIADDHITKDLYCAK